MQAIIRHFGRVTAYDARVRVIRYIVQRYSLPFTYNAANALAPAPVQRVSAGKQS